MLDMITNRTAPTQYTATDLNRVGAAIRSIAEQLTDCGYDITVSAKTAWDYSDIPRQADMNAYIADIQNIRSVFTMFPNTPDAPETARFLSWVSANNIEKILVDAEQLINNMIAAWLQCGDVIAGGEF